MILTGCERIRVSVMLTVTLRTDRRSERDRENGQRNSLECLRATNFILYAFCVNCMLAKRFVKI